MEKVLRVEDGKYLGGEGISGEVELTHLLWTNPDPDTAFAAQTIALDLSKYDFVEIYYFSAGGEGDGLLYTKSSVPGDVELISLQGNTNSAIGTIGRKRNGTVSATGIVFGNGEQVYTGKTIYTVNTANIPVYIYGIKNKVQAIGSEIATTADKCIMSDGVTSVEDEITSINSKIEGETIDISLASDITFSGSAMKIGSMVSISGMFQKTSGYFAIKTHIILGNISYRPSTRITVTSMAGGPSYACGLGGAFVEPNGDLKMVIYEQGTTFNTAYISMTYKSD